VLYCFAEACNTPMDGALRPKGGGGGGGTVVDSGHLLTPWKVGLINYQGKYLTAETFGFNINAAAFALRRKQLWIVEQDLNEDDTVYIRSHLGRYLAGDKKVSNVKYEGNFLFSPC
jgi:Fascin domain